jgi:hypothetical protein
VPRVLERRAAPHPRAGLVVLGGEAGELDVGG